MSCFFRYHCLDCQDTQAALAAYFLVFLKGSDLLVKPLGGGDIAVSC